MQMTISAAVRENNSNLDQEGYALYSHLIQQYALHKLIIVGSNDTAEYKFCSQHLNLMDYKSNSI